jgi:hypothetical protein
VVLGISRDHSTLIFRVKQFESPKSLLIEVGYITQLLGYKKYSCTQTTAVDGALRYWSVQTVQKSKSYLKILGTRRVT